MPDLAPGVRALDASQTRYLLKVHRLRAGDRFVAFDASVECEGEILAATSPPFMVRLAAPRPATILAPRTLRWVHGHPKGDKADAIVRDVTELGATHVVLVSTARSVSGPTEAKRARWARIAEQAARQCGRGDAPEVAIATDWREALATDAATRICLDPRGAALDLPPAGSLAFACGPEGGLTDEELDVARSLGFHIARLGSMTMRTETVPAAVLGAVLLASAW